MQLVVRGGDKASVIGFGHRAALALAPAVDADPVEQVAPRAGLKWVAPLIRRGFVSEACEVDGAGGVEGFLGCAHR